MAENLRELIARKHPKGLDHSGTVWTDPAAIAHILRYWKVPGTAHPTPSLLQFQQCPDAAPSEYTDPLRLLMERLQVRAYARFIPQHLSRDALEYPRVDSEGHQTWPYRTNWEVYAAREYRTTPPEFYSVGSGNYLKGGRMTTDAQHDLWELCECGRVRKPGASPYTPGKPIARPSAQSILGALLMDASLYDDCRDINDFAEQFANGHSISETLRIYEASRRTSKDLRDLLGADYEAAQEAAREM